MFINDAPKARLISLLVQIAMSGDVEPVNLSDPDNLLTAALHGEAGPLIGHAVLDLLEEHGFGPDDVDAIGGMGEGALAVATAVLHATASRGQHIHAFTIRPPVVPSAYADPGRGDTSVATSASTRFHIAGPTIVGRRVVVVDTTPDNLDAAIEAATATGADVVAGAALLADKPTHHLHALTWADLVSR